MKSFVESVRAYLVSLNEDILLVEMVKYVAGHKNSKGEDAPWVIVSHTTGKIIKSFKTEAEAKHGLKMMEYYKRKK